MKNILLKSIKTLAFLVVVLSALQLNAQRRFTPLATSDFNLTLQNDVQTADNVLEFDLYLLDTDALQPFEMAAVQAGILVNPGIYNGGTITISIVPASSGLSNPAQAPTSVVWSQVQNTIKLTPRPAPGAGSGSVISTSGFGTRICRLRITNTVAFTASSQANLTFNFTTSPYPTKVSQYIAGTNTVLVCNASNSFSNLANIVLNPPSAPATTTWTGAIDTDWFKAGNWTDGVPGAITQVTVPGGLVNYPTLVSAATIAGITLNNGASFIGSEFLTTGSALVKRDIINTNFHFISSPVASTTFGSVFPLNQTEVWAREYNETTGDWDNLTIADFLSVGKGYSVQMNQPQTALFAGVLNSAPVTATLAKLNPGADANRVGWNLLGNSFTSAIDWDLTDHSAIDGSVYVWNGSQYVSWNGTTGALTDGLIPAENGFFAKTVVNGATLSIPLTSRVHSSVGLYKSSVADLLELTAQGNSFSDKAFVHFNDQATAGFDNQYDAYKLFGNENTPQLYSMISGDVLSINELPMTGNEVVDLGFKCNTTGVYSVTATGVDNFASTIPVYLQDLKLNIQHDLRINPVYSFSYEAGEPENRFKLSFLNVTGIRDMVTAGIKVYSFDKTVTIENANLLTGEISIYDMTGRVLLSQKLTGQARTNIPLQVTTGMYLVKVLLSNGPVTAKVHIQ